MAVSAVEPPKKAARLNSSWDGREITQAGAGAPPSRLFVKECVTRHIRTEETSELKSLRSWLE